ncbi:MAG: hypothetical protein KAW45_05945 [Thermoplasmatales archaeon]|nr:hypothetical protein [Thermoplasmatales archaeon]
MEKKSIILELSCELIDKIDRLNSMGDRSAFVTHLLDEQMHQTADSGLTPSTELTTKMSETDGLLGATQGLLDITNNEGTPIGKFDINSVEGFEDLAKKIQEISLDPIVRMRAGGWL